MTGEPAAPLRPDLDGLPDTEAAGIIDAGAASAAAGIHTRCDAYTPSDLGYGATCSSTAPCNALPLTTIEELITCLRCRTDDVIDGVAASVF